jgi:ribosomal-protein-alanine N-acetyltransferase
MEAVIAYAFGPLGLARLWARFHAGNQASQRLLEKLGFVYEGTLRGHILRDGERRDCVLYGKLKSDP